ncbi:molecular chaperone GroEL [Clostridiaceae bacterium]|mgnify:CR=1 FL=1|nr:molecular chaperone GroEL [Clostridiaceae bacterium]
MKRLSFKRFKRFSLIVTFILCLCGCTPSRNEIASTPSFEVDVNPETFELSLRINDQVIPISSGMEKNVIENYKEENNIISWQYPQKQLRVRLISEQDYLNVEITSEKNGDNTVCWPYISAEQYYLPLGEGKRIPAKDSNWIRYLDQQQVSVLEQLSMPFWISSNGEYCVLFIMEHPYRTQLNFTSETELLFSVSHEFPEICRDKTYNYRIYVTKKDPVIGAKIYRNYVIEKNNFVTLNEKAEQNFNIEKLYGAPFIYLWGDFIVSADDINWHEFCLSLDSPVMTYLRSFAKTMETGNEFETVLAELKHQDYVAVYQKNVICNYISQILIKDGFWNPEILTERNHQIDEFLQEGYEKLTASQKIQFHKKALSVNMPMVFSDSDRWMDSNTLDVIHDMKENGIGHAWIGLNSWEQAYRKPELVSQAANIDYLIASYDSYHSIHEPGKEQWITACFDDIKLYENATIMNKNGTKESGFQGVGRKLNATLSMPSVNARMSKIMENHLPFNSWFIDCDSTGEIYDDYTTEHKTTQEQDLFARLERMSYIRDQYQMVIGSEGGNDFAASTIAFAHGIELHSFAWMDEDMKSNKDSAYYIGNYYNPAGGVAEHFAKRIPIKEEYFSVFVDPKYDIPLFKLVYNDSVITAAHWDWSTFKIKGATQDRMIREVLYNVPPLYHLDHEQWKEYQQDIVNHHKIWSEFSQKAIQKEMTDFLYLKEDGSVQKTSFGDELSAVANFSERSYVYENTEIPPHSVWVKDSNKTMIYIPALEESHK